MLRVFLLALKASSQKEREKRSQHFHSKALESSVFFNQKRAVFCTKKKRKNKILARKTPLRVSRRTTQRRKRRTERERKFIRLLFFPSRAFLEDFFRARERFTERQRENERISFVCRRLLRQKTERRFRGRTHIGSEKTKIRETL